MVKKIYWQSVKKYGLTIGLPSGIVGFALLFIYLNSLGVIEIISHSGDSVCAGTIEEPCIALISFQAKEDIFIYPTDYDPYGRNTPFYTDKGLKSWKIYRSWGNGWREIKLTEKCTSTWCGAPPNSPDNLYSFAFRKGKTYDLKIEAIKENSFETIKWGFFDLDPFWYGLTSPTTQATNITMELGSQINITANLTGYSGQVCVDIDHPSYGNNYSCGTPSANFLFNISYFRNNQFNDTNVSKNVTWINGGNQTIYIKQHQYDDIVNMSLNVSGYVTNGTYPTNVKIYVNNTLSKSFSFIYTGNIILNTFNDSTSSKNATFDYLQTKTYYLNIPKVASVLYAYLNLTGYGYNHCFQETANVSTSCGGLNTGNYALDTNLSLNCFSQGCLYDSNYTTNFLYINYTKPQNSTNATWQVKHGAYLTYNVSIPKDCFDYSKLSLRFRSAIYIVQYASFGECYNGTNWIKITNTANGFGGSTSADNNSSYLFDGNYNTHVLINSPFIPEYGSWARWESGNLQAGAIYEEGVDWIMNDTYPTNTSLEVGVNDGTPEWNYTNYFNISQITSNFNISINTTLSTCTQDSNGNCVIPLYLTSTNGIIQIRNINISYSYNPNPIYLNLNSISSFLGNSTNFANIPLKFESSQNGTLQISDIRLDYAGGNDTIEIKVHNSSSDYINCYQETTNVSTSTDGNCGLNYSGNYVDYGCDHTFGRDGNWSSDTGACLASDTTLFMNYIKPSGFSNAIWQVKDDNGQINLTLPSSCVVNNYINLSALMTYQNDFNVPTYWRCLNSSGGYEILRTVQNESRQYSTHIYEEAIIWNLTLVEETINITNYYSKWNYNFPYKVNYLEFIPKSPTSKNVTPYGQTSLTPIFNITTYNYGGKNMNLSIYLNQSMSCVNLTYSTNNNKSNGTLLTNQTWYNVKGNLEYLNNSKIFLWADFGCNFTTWSLFQPDIFLRGCGYDLNVCDERFI